MESRFRSIQATLLRKENEWKDRMHRLNLQLTDFQHRAIPPEFMQVFVMTVFVSLFWFCALGFVLLFLFGLFWDSSYLSLTLIFAHFVYTAIDETHCNGGRSWKAFRQASFWRHFRDYFPLEVRVKTPGLKLKPDKIYMLGYHPHGLTSMGAMGSFSPQYSELEPILGNVQISGCTLESNFRIPLLRELLLAMGAVSVSEKSIKAVLSKGPGHAVAIVLGGASEALLSKPGTHDLVVNRRKGFFRIALQTGASIIPVYCFGENDLYDQISDGVIGQMNHWFIKASGFFLPVYFGTGLFCFGETPFNPVPKRTPLITVLGDPIDVERIPNPSKEEIEQLKALYIAGLADIFDRFADIYSPKRTRNLNIVE